MSLPRILLCLLLLTTSFQVAAGLSLGDSACGDDCMVHFDTEDLLGCSDGGHCGDHASDCTAHCMPALGVSPVAEPDLESNQDLSAAFHPVLDSPPARLLRPPIPV
jgi:hypothetical protein